MKPLVQKTLCMLLVQTLAGAQLSLAANLVWPTPSPQPRPPLVQPNQQRMLARPNFEAPSATHCQRPIETRELSDGQARPQVWPRPVPYAEPMPGLAYDGADARLKSEARRDIAPSAAAPAMAAPPPSGAVADGKATEKLARSAAGDAPRWPPAQPVPQEQNQGPVTAGMVDDNAAFSEYLAFRK
ncbi:MAG: hypothetical protein HXX19_15960, partial [Rhodoferax sp.]|nr:hypothetical protein [Rhodoferax sp.]